MRAAATGASISPPKMPAVPLPGLKLLVVFPQLSVIRSRMARMSGSSTESTALSQRMSFAPTCHPEKSGFPKTPDTWSAAV